MTAILFLMFSFNLFFLPKLLITFTPKTPKP